MREVICSSPANELRGEVSDAADLDSTFTLTDADGHAWRVDGWNVDVTVLTGKAVLQELLEDADVPFLVREAAQLLSRVPVNLAASGAKRLHRTFALLAAEAGRETTGGDDGSCKS